MKILIPIMGTGRNKESHYFKGLQEINRKMIFQHIYEMLVKIDNAEFIVVIRKEDMQKYYFDDMLRLMIPNVKIVVAEGNTSGAVCSCLLAIEEIGEDEPLIIASSNQLISVNPNEIVQYFQKNDFDGGVVTFKDLQPYWTYVRLNNDGHVIETAEKRTISKNATVGLYYFKKSSFFVKSSKKIIQKRACVEQKYYVCTCYNEMILQHCKIGAFSISKESYFNFDYEKDIVAFENYLWENINK